jgi:SOS-response transcriptional repressor LexA
MGYYNKKSDLPTDSEKAVYEYIKRFIKKYSVSPSFYDIANEFDWLVGSASYRIKGLQKKGYIDYIPGKYRTIRILK